MKKLVLIGLLMLGACSTDPLATKFVSAKVQAGGFNMNSTMGVTGGYVAGTWHTTPTVAADGKTLLTVAQPCGQTDVIATYSNLNSKASATASSVSPSTPSAGGVQAPAIAWASGDTAATGAAARMLALGGGQAPTPPALVAYQQSCGSGLPAAPATSVVVTGVAPK